MARSALTLAVCILTELMTRVEYKEENGEFGKLYSVLSLLSCGTHRRAMLMRPSYMTKAPLVRPGTDVVRRPTRVHATDRLQINGLSRQRHVRPLTFGRADRAGRGALPPRLDRCARIQLEFADISQASSRSLSSSRPSSWVRSASERADFVRRSTLPTSSLCTAHPAPASNALDTTIQLHHIFDNRSPRARMGSMYLRKSSSCCCGLPELSSRVDEARS